MKICIHSEGFNGKESIVPWMEVRQILEIDASGSIHFVSYHQKGIKREIQRNQNVETLLSMLLKVSKQTYETIPYLQNWSLYIDGRLVNQGPMHGKVIVDGINATDEIRKEIDIPGLFAFDNTDRQDLGLMYCAE